LVVARRPSGIACVSMERAHQLFEVSPFLLVFIANSLENIAVGKRDFRDFYGGERLGIVDGDLDVHVAEVASIKTLLQM